MVSLRHFSLTLHKRSIHTFYAGRLFSWPVLKTVQSCSETRKKKHVPSRRTTIASMAWLLNPSSGCGHLAPDLMRFPTVQPHDSHDMSWSIMIMLCSKLSGSRFHKNDVPVHVILLQAAVWNKSSCHWTLIVLKPLEEVSCWFGFAPHIRNDFTIYTGKPECLEEPRSRRMPKDEKAWDSNY